MKKVSAILVFPIAMLFALLQMAIAMSEPIVSITLDKKSVEIGEPVTAIYKIEGSGIYSEIQWDSTMWVSEYEGQIIPDDDNSLNSLEGSITYIPRFGEATSLILSFVDETGRRYNFESEKIPVLGYSVKEPTVAINLDKETIRLGEPVTATYKIEGSGIYSEIQWDGTMWVSEYEGQIIPDDDNSLNSLEGRITYIPRFGEATSLILSFVDETRRWYSFESKKAKIEGFSDEYEVYSVIEGQNTQTSTGETSLVFRANGDYEKYLGIQVDGRDVPSKYVKSWPGSTYVELGAEYLRSIPEGEHELTIVFNDGVAATRFSTIRALSGLPQTGDGSHIVFWLVLMVIAGVGMQKLLKPAHY